MIQRYSICLLLLIGASTPAFSQNDEKKLRQQLTELRQEISTINDSISASRIEKDDLLEQLMLIERDLSRRNRDLKRIENKIDKETKTLHQLTKQQTRLQNSLKSQQAGLKSQIRSAFILGRQERIKLLFNQESVSEASRILAYFRYFNLSRVRNLDTLTQSLNELSAVEKEILQRKQELSSLQSAQLIQIGTKEDVVLQRKSVLSKIDKRIESQSQILTRLKSNQADLQDLLNQLGKVLADIPDEFDQNYKFSRLKRKLIWPVNGQILHSFSSSRAQDLKWDGLVIAANLDQEIRVIAHGRVAYSDWFRGFGLLTIVDHGEGFMSLYGYQQTLYKEAGDWVETGEVIGGVGSSGGRIQPSLYFELRKNSKPINPNHWFAASLN